MYECFDCKYVCSLGERLMPKEARRRNPGPGGTDDSELLVKRTRNKTLLVQGQYILFKC